MSLKVNKAQRQSARLKFLYGEHEQDGPVEESEMLNQSSHTATVNFDDAVEQMTVDGDLTENSTSNETSPHNQHHSFVKDNFSVPGGYIEPPVSSEETSVPGFLTQRSFSIPGGFVEPSHAEPARNNSNMQTLANFVRGNVGTGVLSLPHAFRSSGLILGTIGTLLCGILTGYCMNQLLTAFKRVNDGRKYIDYAQLARLTFERSEISLFNRLAKPMQYLVNFFIALTQFGTLIVYIVFIGRMVKEIVDLYLPQYDDVPLTYFITGTTLMLIPYCFVTTLSVLSVFSTVANMITIICFIVILQYLLRNSQPVENVKLMTHDFNDFFMFFGTASFAYASIPVVLPLRAHMRDPGALAGIDGVISLGITVVMAMYAAVGFYGYLSFGDDSLLILRNLPETWLYQLVKLLWTICVFLAFNLQLYIVINMIWPPLKKRINSPIGKRFGEYGFRTTVILTCYFLAIFVPCLEQLISLVGSLAMATLSFCFPSILEIVAELPLKPCLDADLLAALSDNTDKKLKIVESPIKDEKKQNIYLVTLRGCLIVIIGLFGAVAGTTMAVVEIVEKLQSPEGC